MGFLILLFILNGFAAMAVLLFFGIKYAYLAAKEGLLKLFKKVKRWRNSHCKE